MKAEKLQIHARYRQHMGVVTSLTDFERSAAGQLDAEQLWQSRDFRLYCLDEARRRAIFTALPAGTDLSGAPFMYQAQFEGAEFLAALPFADFIQLAAGIPLDQRQLLCLHNIGRCGSTVLSRAFSEIEGVLSISEPDVLTNFLRMRGLPHQQQVALLRACLSWICRPVILEDCLRVAIKFRNQAAGIMPLYVDALP